MPLPEHSNSAELGETVRRHQAEAMIDTARLIASFPDSAQRQQEARRQVSMAMVEYALGRLQESERCCILQILYPCCPGAFVQRTIPPPPELPGLAGD